MSYRQLVTPNLAVTGKVGYCLAYVVAAFNVYRPDGKLYASQAWQATEYKHLDQNFPTDVALPIWFDYYQDNLNSGHVAINVPGKGIYSSPWKAGTDHAVLGSVAELIKIYSNNGAYPMKFLGWSEDINGVRVVQGESMDKITKEQEKLCAIGRTGSEPGVDYDYRFTGLPLTQDNLDKMLQFWMNQPGPPTDYVPVGELFVKKT